MMYALEPSASNENRFVLRRSRRVNVAMLAATVAVGVPMVLAGIVALAFSNGHALSMMLAGAGASVIALSQLVSNQFRAPERLVFDNSRGQLFIDETGKEHEHAATVPYEAIEGFRCLPYTALSGAGHGTPSAVVEMTKRNGAVWALSRRPSKADAEALAATLQQRVELDRSGQSPSQTHQPKLVHVSHQGENTVIRWRRRYSMVQSGLLFAAMAGLSVAVYGAEGLVSAALFYGALGCSCLLAGLALYAALAAAFRSRTILITSDTLQTNCAAGKLGSLRMPLAQVDAVVFHFAPSQRDTLFVLRANERERLIALTRGKVSIQDALAARALSAKVARIEVGDLPMPDKLNLEQLLQRLIRDRTGRVIR